MQFHSVNMFRFVDQSCSRQTVSKATPEQIRADIAEMCRAYEIHNRAEGDCERAVHWQMVADYAEGL